jgi:hypothetical protein
MRFMTLVKSSETLGPPPKPLVDAMERYKAAAVKEGRVVATGGLAPSAMGARVRVSKGKLIVTDGPFSEAKEVIGGYGVLEVSSREEAIEQTKWLLQQFIEFWPGWEGEVEVRQVFAPEDFTRP